MSGESLVRYRQLGNWKESAALNTLGCLEMDRGAYAAAAPHLEQSHRLSRDTGNPFWIAKTASNLAQLAAKQGDTPRAAALLSGMPGDLERSRQTDRDRCGVGGPRRCHRHGKARPCAAARLFATAASLREAAVAPLTGDARAATASKRLPRPHGCRCIRMGDRLGRRQGDVPPEGLALAHETNWKAERQDGYPPSPKPGTTCIHSKNWSPKG